MKDNGKHIIINIKEFDFNNDENCNQIIQGKYGRKSIGGNIPTKENPDEIWIGNGGQVDGHNYTVSINFNRPQQSKGQRIKISKLSLIIALTDDQKKETKKAWNKGNLKNWELY